MCMIARWPSTRNTNRSPEMRMKNQDHISQLEDVQEEEAEHHQAAAAVQDPGPHPAPALVPRLVVGLGLPGGGTHYGRIYQRSQPVMDTVTLDQPAVAPGPKSVCCWRWLGPR